MDTKSGRIQEKQETEKEKEQEEKESTLRSIRKMAKGRRK
jgi:hypothetical protein